MKVLVINAGSSSLKYQLIDMETETTLAKGLCERIGDGGHFTHKVGGNKWERDVVMPDHTAAFAEVKRALTEGEGKVIHDLSEVSAIGHRVVQGGAKYDRSVRIDDSVIAAIREFASLAPLHNPAHLQGIEAATATFGTAIPQVAVFDTAFHQTMPEIAYLWGLPYEYYEKYGVRRYGFHGTSHRFVSARCAELLGKPDAQGTRIITCHIGNGASLAAIKDGKVIDTTMGLTPLDGFMMGTRSGAVDPSAITFIMKKEGLTPDEMDTVLNKKSGMLGVSGRLSDDRDIAAAMHEGDHRAELAWKMRNYQVVKTIGAFTAALGGLDALVFTAGVGENQQPVRAAILNALGYMGIRLDEAANETRGEEIEITAPGSAVRAFVIPTNEELVIARDTVALI